MATNLSEKIKQVAAEAASARGLNLLHAVVRGTDSRPVIELTIDGDKLVSVEDCETVSKHVQTYLDEEGNQHLNYRLDVLSPGVDEPIIYDYQLKRSIGRVVKLATDETAPPPHEVTGPLVGFDAETVTIDLEKPTSRGQAPKKLGQVVIERARILSLRQIAVIR